MYKVMIDAGHGGFDPGAVGPTGRQEKDVALIVATRVGQLLSGTVEVIFSRTTDVACGYDIESDVNARWQMANQAGVNAFVSIHNNSADDPSANGTETYSDPGASEGARLALAIQTQLINYLGLFDRGPKTANFAVVKYTNCPAVLAELAFISNPNEEQLLGEPEFLEKAARAIAVGIATYFGLLLELPSMTQVEETRAPKIQVNGHNLEGIIQDGRTYAPVRAFGDALGLPVVWNSVTGAVTIGGQSVIVQVISNRSYAPVRSLAEAMGHQVSWDQASQTAIVK